MLSQTVLVYWQKYDLMTKFNLFISLNADLKASEGSIPLNSLLRLSSFTPRQFPQPRECDSAFLSYYAVRKTSQHILQKTCRTFSPSETRYLCIES